MDHGLMRKIRMMAESNLVRGRALFMARIGRERGTALTGFWKCPGVRHRELRSQLRDARPFVRDAPAPASRQRLGPQVARGECEVFPGTVPADCTGLQQGRRVV